jgi:hypothetical protein
MDDSGRGRLIIVCGLPGAGKTTYGKALERRLPSVRLCPDEWMDALSIDLYDETSRGRIEALQSTLGKRLLELGLIVIIEWGTGGGPNGMVYDWGPGHLARSLSCIISLCRRMYFSTAFSAGIRRNRRSNATR